MARAIDALRHGWPIALEDAPILLPVETGIALGGAHGGDGEHGASTVSPLMLISSARAATLKLTNQMDAAAPHAPVLIRGAEQFDLTSALAIADPALDLCHPMKGPFRAEMIEWHDAALAALELARIAGILPAFLVNPDHANPQYNGEAESLSASDLADWADTSHLTIAARAKLPVAAAEDAQIIAFRSMDDMREHIALIIGNQSSARDPLVRLHSECLTGDILSSLKCDCGPQLNAALQAMAAEAEKGGWGILLYLRQEGRGIGLINKLRAYNLQDQGFDTVDANQRLGLPDEARDFPVAARMLDLIGARSIRLMTNNPRKVAAFADSGIIVRERVPHQLPDNPHNRHYLATKRDRSGHLLE